MAKTTSSPYQYSRPTLTYEEQLQKQNNQREIQKNATKKKAEVAKTTTALANLKQQEARVRALMINASKDAAAKKKAYEDLKKTVLLPSSDGGATITPAEQQAVELYAGIWAQAQAEFDKYMGELSTVSSKRLAAERSLTDVVVAAPKKTLNTFKTSKKTTKSKSGSDKPIQSQNNDAKIPNPLQYYYNAPMVKTAYFKGGSLQDQYKNLVSNNPGNFASGIDAWKDSYGAKGVIQMDSNNAQVYANSVNADGSAYDPNLYGFKFLYNPKEVSMTWGVAEGMNLEGIRAGLDPGNLITPGLMYSTINFSLLLNRIGDMSCVGPYGLLAGVENPYPTFSISPTSNLDKELAEIYKKGTMYDMEYFFRSIKGLNSKNKNIFNVETADVGWLQGIAVELHLGDGMHYSVRINSLEVNHAMFNDRMVPILSYVNISCSRFNDFYLPGN